MSNYETTITTMAQTGRQAANQLVRVSSDQKNAALGAIAAGLEKDAAFIKEENGKDLVWGHEKGGSIPHIHPLSQVPCR